jgi:PEP-CTERM motif
MRKVVPALAAAAFATLAAGSAARAAVVDFSGVSLCPTTCTGISYTGSALETSTAYDLDGTTWFVNIVKADDQSGLQVGNSFTLVPTTLSYGMASGVVDITLTTPLVKTWTATTGPDLGDKFTETLNTLTSISRGASGSNAITFDFAGEVTGGTLFNDTPVQLVLALTQAGGPKNIVDAEVTNEASETVPEPSTWVMLALGFAGLGYAAVRRNAKERSGLAI